MEDRETYEVITPAGRKVVLRSWITGRESQDIDNAMFSGLKSTGDGKRLTPEISSTMLSDQENASIKAVVVSVDNKNNDIVETVLNLRKSEYDFIIKEVNRVVDGDLDEKKEKSSEPNTISSSNEEKDGSQTQD